MSVRVFRLVGLTVSNISVIVSYRPLKTFLPRAEMLNPPLKWLPGIPAQPMVDKAAVPAVVIDATGRKLCDCDSDEVAQMVVSLPDMVNVVAQYIANPHNPQLKELALFAMAKFDGIGPFAKPNPTGTE